MKVSRTTLEKRIPTGWILSTPFFSSFFCSRDSWAALLELVGSLLFVSLKMGGSRAVIWLTEIKSIRSGRATQERTFSSGKFNGMLRFRYDFFMELSRGSWKVFLFLYAIEWVFILRVKSEIELPVYRDSLQAACNLNSSTRDSDRTGILQRTIMERRLIVSWRCDFVESPSRSNGRDGFQRVNSYTNQFLCLCFRQWAACRAERRRMVEFHKNHPRRERLVQMLHQAYARYIHQHRLFSQRSLWVHASIPFTQGVSGRVVHANFPIQFTRKWKKFILFFSGLLLLIESN